MGARAKRTQRVRAAVGPIWDELDALTRDSHKGAVFHTNREQIEAAWFATPFMRTRDSDALAESNYQVIKADLEAISPDGVTDHRFGHWGFGWFEQIYIRRDDPRLIRAVEAWVIALSDYPVANEEHFCALEWEMDHPDGDEGECYSQDPDCPCREEIGYR
jgi:hypothetical protein